jgi:cell division septation protein DedD
MNKHAWILLGATLAGCASAPPAPQVERAAPAPPTITEQPAPPPPPAQIEQMPSRPEQTDNGRWRVSVASERTAEQTADWVKLLEGQGFRVATEAAEVEGTTWHRVLLPGYRTVDDARHVIAWLGQQAGMPGAWIPPKAGAAAAPAPEPAEPAAEEQPGN